MVQTIVAFTDKHRFLSNFYPAEVEYEGVKYPTVEHAYQAAKTIDLIQRQQLIKTCQTPSQANKFGYTVTLRNDWDDMKLKVMWDLLKQKFYNHPDLKKKLIETGEAELIEGNYWHDNYWGACTCEKCVHKKKYNYLGRSLMYIRLGILAKG
jgi:hypothetical protein